MGGVEGNPKYVCAPGLETEEVVSIPGPDGARRGSPEMLELNVGGAETSGVQPPLALQLDREGGAIKTPAWWHRLWDTAGQETAENGSGIGEWRMEESQPKGGVEERGEGVEEEEVTKS